MIDFFVSASKIKEAAMPFPRNVNIIFGRNGIVLVEEVEKIMKDVVPEPPFEIKRKEKKHVVRKVHKSNILNYPAAAKVSARIPAKFLKRFSGSVHFIIDESLLIEQNNNGLSRRFSASLIKILR